MAKEKAHSRGNAPGSVASRFVKGQKRSPAAGRKAGTTLTKLTWAGLHEKCRKQLGDKLSFEHPRVGEITDLDVLIYVKLWEAIEQGQSWAITQALDRRLGRPPITAEPGAPANAKVSVAWSTPILKEATAPEGVEGATQIEATEVESEGKTRSGAPVDMSAGMDEAG